MKNKTHLVTHIKNLSGRFNLQIENIENYCANNNVSDVMKNKIIKIYMKEKQYENIYRYYKLPKLPK